MKLRMFSVVGEALNFGLRRMETIMRVAWLPVVLLLVFNMVQVFAVLSVANERVITFGDLAANVSFGRAAAIANAALMKGVLGGSTPMLIIYFTGIAINVILVASFMAPLIRFAGVGERPAPGVVRIPFGPDQVRYVLALFLAAAVSVLVAWGPIWAASHYIVEYVGDAMRSTYASFPNPESLHTIREVPGLEVMKASDRLWLAEYGLWAATAGVLFVVLWIGLVWHFHPRSRSAESKRPNIPARAAAIFILLSAFVWAIASRASGGILEIGKTADASLLAFLTLAGLVLIYVGLRLFPYSGVVVCKRSLAVGNTLAVTRGWNLVRLIAAMLLLGLILIVVFLLVNIVAVPATFTVIGILQAAVSSYTKLYNSGEVAAWVTPSFAWTRTILAIIINLFWAFFTYGVNAGLLGRLYRESERTD